MQIKNKSNECISDPNEIFNELNSYFSNVGLNLPRTMSGITTCKPPNIKPPIKLFFLNISTDYMILCILNMNDNKSVAFTMFLSNTSKCPILLLLSYLINLCINLVCFPSYLKIAQAIPIFKSGENDEPSSDCPISLLNPVCKIFKKYLYEQINQYFVKYNCLFKTQFGF